MRQLVEIPSPAPGVQAHEAHRKGTLPFDLDGNDRARDVITERLYRCPNGWQLGARRGGRLHAADEHSWEIFVLDHRGVASGDTAGYVDEPTLERAVRRLAQWGGTRCEANREDVIR